MKDLPEKFSPGLILRLDTGFSPCPNDTFIFDALVHGRTDTEGLHFDPVLEDVETLNRRAVEGKLPVTKLSFAAYLSAARHYRILDAGGALGFGAGPLLVTRSDRALPAGADLAGMIPRWKIAIPGAHTTAYLLFRLLFPEAGSVREMVFSSVESAVLSGDADAGLLIHEGRFTYAQKGLKKLADLGEAWEAATSLPVPLGCIAVRRDLPQEVQAAVGRSLRRSVQYALDHPEASGAFVAQHAQEMDASVREQHIRLYVNDYSRSFGTLGRRAIDTLFERAVQAGLAPPAADIFAEAEAAW